MRRKNMPASLTALVIGALFPLEQAAAACAAPPPPARQSYFKRMGVGVDYGPHYPCYSVAQPQHAPPAVAQCYTHTGVPAPSTMADAKNNEFQASAPLDLQQIRAAGFSAVRAYGDPSKSWIAMINTANVQGAGLKVVYQVALCKSDDAPGRGRACIDQPGVTFPQALLYAQAQLAQVIAQVTPAVFQKIVSLIIVGNEDLVISPTDNKTYNTADLIAAIAATRVTLAASRVPVNTATSGTPNGVDLSSAVVIGQMTTPPGKMLARAFTPMAPVIENIYPAQFTAVTNAQQAIAFLQTQIDTLQAAYPNNSAMLGETGWWTAGQDANYQAGARVGTLPAAIAYFQLLYPYLNDCKVPALIFEAYDQPTKNLAGARPNPPGALQAEQNYGVMSAFNVAKSLSLLPQPSQAFQDHPETRNMAIFTFNQFLAPPNTINGVPPMTFGLPGAGGAESRQTVKPFAMVTANGGVTPVWPTFNLPAGATVSLYHKATDAAAQCSNVVASLNSISVGGAAPYSGGSWKTPGYSAQGCPPFTANAVNWANGQNVFLPQNFSTNPATAPVTR